MSRHTEEERIVPETALWDEQIGEHEQRYAFVAARLRPGMRVLDAGCGVGYGSALLADRGAASVAAVDRSAEALAVARARFDRDSVTWICEDCQDLDEAARFAPFDLICNLENLEHLSDAAGFLHRASGLLEPEGMLVTSTPNRIGVNRLRGRPPEAASPNPFHVREYTSAEFRELLKQYFREVALHFQTFDPVERMEEEVALSRLSRSPIRRIGRLIRRSLGASESRPADRSPPRRYQILDVDPGDNRVITQLGICREPRR